MWRVCYVCERKRESKTDSLRCEIFAILLSLTMLRRLGTLQSERLQHGFNRNNRSNRCRDNTCPLRRFIVCHILIPLTSRKRYKYQRSMSKISNRGRRQRGSEVKHGRKDGQPVCVTVAAGKRSWPSLSLSQLSCICRHHKCMIIARIIPLGLATGGGDRRQANGTQRELCCSTDCLV